MQVKVIPKPPIPRILVRHISGAPIYIKSPTLVQRNFKKYLNRKPLLKKARADRVTLFLNTGCLRTSAQIRKVQTVTETLLPIFFK